MRITSALTLFLLFCFSATFADIDSVDQGLANQNQNTIKSKLALYLENFSSKDPEFVKKFKENKGL